MSTDFTEQQDSNIRIGLKDDRTMTIIPKPIKKPFRHLEIAAGLVFIAAGLWLVIQFGLWLAGADPQVHIRSFGEAALILVQSVYLIGISVNLLRTGRVALVFWMIAVAILATLPLTTGLFG